MDEYIYSNSKSNSNSNSDFQDTDYEYLISRLKKIKANITLLENFFNLNK